MLAQLQVRWFRLMRFLTPDEPEIADYPFVPSDVALYHRTGFAPSQEVLDDQTWDDMLLPQYSAQLARETSVFGQQELHHRLRGAEPAQSGFTSLDASTRRVRALTADPARLRQLHETCEGLRRAELEVSETLFGAAPPAPPGWVAYLHWLPLGFLLSLFLGLATGSLAMWGSLVVCWLALMLVQMRFHEEVEQWSRILRTLQQMLRTHSRLAKLDDPWAASFGAGAARAGKINRAISRSPLDMLPGAREYSDWVMLKNTRHYFASRALVLREIEFLRESFTLIATLEADIALARHLVHAPRYCWAEQGDSVALERVVHPLLAQAAPLSFGMQGQGAFISGQNGIGKSTLLRTVGLNLITARAFGFCYADAATTPMLPVYSSMQSEDTLDGGESLYIAELRRAQELLALAERAPAVFIIDEIFRGTNHLESISAATAVLHTLAASGRVMVSSHNLVLAPLLADCLAPWCVSRVGDVLQVEPGVLRVTNGIALLGARGFDDAISAKANRVFDWLSDYLAHPTDCEGIRNSL